MKKAVSLILLTVLCLTLASCSRDVRAEHCELGIILPDDFHTVESDGTFDAAYTDGSLTVGMTRISFAHLVDAGIPATLSLREFAELYRRGEGVDKRVFDYGDTVYYTYDKDGYRLIHTFFKTPYAYFVITFAFTQDGKWDIESALELTDTVYLSANNQ